MTYFRFRPRLTLTMKRNPSVKRAQIVSLHDFLQDPNEINQRQQTTSEFTTTPDLDIEIEAICTKYNITNLVPESVKWVQLHNKKKSTVTPGRQGPEDISPPPPPSPPGPPVIVLDAETVSDTHPTQSADQPTIENCHPQPEFATPIPKKQIRCKLCHKVFQNRASRKKHRLLYHPKKPNNSPSASTFFCTICGNRFASQEILSCHDRIHQRGRKYGCDICGLRFVLQTEAREHAKAHTGEKPFGCLICGRAFRLGSSLDLHIKWKHDGYTTSREEEEGRVKREEPEVIILS